MAVARLIEDVARDVAHAARSLRRSVGVTATAVAILALGIGANTTIFRFVSALLLQPPPVTSPETLRQVWNLNARARSPIERYVPLTYPQYAMFRDRARHLSSLLAFDGDPATLSWMRGGRGEMVQAQFVSGNFFSTLGVNATVGTTALPADESTSDGAARLVVSDRFWRTRLGADPAVVGAPITVNGVAFTIAGVAPPGFTGLLIGLAPDVWVPLALSDAVRHETGRLKNHTTFWLLTAGRLTPGATDEAVRSELRVLARQYAASVPPTRTGPGEDRMPLHDVAVFPATMVPGPFRGFVGAFVGLLQAVVVLLLTIACANAANLFLAHAAARRPELAVRASLGASRGRLVQLVLAQTVLVGLLAGGAALVVARQTAPLLLQLIPPTLPVHLELTMDWRVLVFATALALAAGLLFGLAPALRVTSDLTTAWRRGASGGRRGARLRDGLVVAQVAVSLVLLVAGALCWRSLRRAQSADPGFRVARRVAAQVDLGTLGYTDSAGRLFQRRLVERVAALPGVRHVSTTHALPLATSRTVVGVETGAGAPALEVQEFAVGPDYFRTMDTPLLGGREFAAADDERAPKVAIVNDAAARRLWPNETAVGKRLTIDVAGVKADYAVIGVVATGKYRTLSERPTPVLFLADRQSYRPRVTLIAEVDGTTPAAALAAIRGEVARLDPDLVVQTGTLQEHLAFALFPSRVSGLALSVVGLLGLGLALAGLAAVVAQSVARRTREIGIRMALGATRADVLAEVVRDGARLLAVGVAVGAVVALGVTRVLSGLLYGISATDPATFAAVTALLVATALAACALAGRRALAVDPIEAIRAE